MSDTDLTTPNAARQARTHGFHWARMLGAGAIGFAGLGFAEETCLAAENESYSQETSAIGLTQVRWEAELVNGCDAPFNADLSIDFLDADGTSVYTVQDRAIVGIQERKAIGNRISVPAAPAEQMDSFRIQIIERERPF